MVKLWKMGKEVEKGWKNDENRFICLIHEWPGLHTYTGNPHSHEKMAAIWYVCLIYIYIYTYTHIFWAYFMMYVYTLYISSVSLSWSYPSLKFSASRVFSGEVKLFPRSIGAEPVFSIAKCRGRNDQMSPVVWLAVGCCYHERSSHSLIFFIYNPIYTNIYRIHIYIYSAWDIFHLQLSRILLPLRDHSSGRWWIWNRLPHLFVGTLTKLSKRWRIWFVFDRCCCIFFCTCETPIMGKLLEVNESSPLMLFPFKLPIGVQYIRKYSMMSDRIFVSQQVFVFSLKSI